MKFITIIAALAATVIAAPSPDDWNNWNAKTVTVTAYVTKDVYKTVDKPVPTTKYETKYGKPQP